MRTTVTLDDDVLGQLRTMMKAEDKSFKQALNDAVRRGIGAARSAGQRKRRFKVRPHRSEFQSGIDVGKLNQLVDQLDAEAFLQRTGASAVHGRT